jgi:hypothetical protein
MFSLKVGLNIGLEREHLCLRSVSSIGGEEEEKKVTDESRTSQGELFCSTGR